MEKKIVNVVYIYDDGSTSTISMDSIVDNLLRPQELEELTPEDEILAHVEKALSET